MYKIVLMVSLIFLYLLTPFVSAEAAQDSFSNRWEICESNHTWCSSEGNKIEICAQDGGESSVLKECASGEICTIKEGQPSCVEAKEKTQITKWIMGILVFLVIVLLVILLRKKLAKS